VIGCPRIYRLGRLQSPFLDHRIRKLDEMHYLEPKVFRGQIEHLRIIRLPHPVALRATQDHRLRPGGFYGVDIAARQCLRFIDHADGVERVPATPLIRHQHERRAGGIEDLRRGLGDLGVQVGGRAAHKVEDIPLGSHLDVTSQPFLPVLVGGAKLVVGLCDILGHLLVGGHGTRAILYGLDSQRLQGELDFEVEVSLTAHITGAAQGVRVDDFQEFRSPLKSSFSHRNADSHFAESAIGIEIIPGIARAPRAEVDSRHVGVLHPVASFTFNAPAHIVNKIIQLSYF
jgi:hypothetical protein